MPLDAPPTPDTSEHKHRRGRLQPEPLFYSEHCDNIPSEDEMIEETILD